MKEIMLAAALACVLLSGCSNNFARAQYNANDIIAENSNRYAKVLSVLNSLDDSVTFTAAKFDGRETVWSENYSEDTDVEIQITLSIDTGKVKLVHIDSDDNVTVIAECTPESSIENASTYTVNMKKGRNRFKVVGYDCTKLNFTMDIA